MSFEYEFDGSTFVFKVKKNSQSLLIQENKNTSPGIITVNRSNTSKPHNMLDGNSLGKKDFPNTDVNPNEEKDKRTRNKKVTKKKMSRKEEISGSETVLNQTTRLEERGFRTESDSTGQKKYFCNHCEYKILN